MPGLISDGEARVTPSCLQPCMPLLNVWFTHNANHFLCIMLMEKPGGGNLVDILNEVSSPSLVCLGLQERIPGPLRSGAVHPQLRKHRQLRTVTL